MGPRTAARAPARTAERGVAPIQPRKSDAAVGDGPSNNRQGVLGRPPGGVSPQGSQRKGRGRPAFAGSLAPSTNRPQTRHGPTADSIQTVHAASRRGLRASVGSLSSSWAYDIARQVLPGIDNALGSREPPP